MCPDVSEPQGNVILQTVDHFTAPQISLDILDGSGAQLLVTIYFDQSDIDKS